MLRIFLLALVGVAVVAASSMSRATWIPTSEYPNITQADFNFLAKLGLRRVYLDGWNDGKAYFNSTTLETFMSQHGRPGEAFAGDEVGRMAAMAKAAGITEVIVWFEYGFMAQYFPAGSSRKAFASVTQSAGWELGVEGNFLWEDPRQMAPLLAGMLVDSVSGSYGSVVDGVQVDDHFACPSSFSSCSVSVMDNAAELVHNTFKAQAPGKLLTISPAPIDFAASRLNVGWPSWAKRVLFDQFTPQLYTSSYTSFLQDVSRTLSQLPTNASSNGGYALCFGLRGSGTGSPTPWNALEAMVQHSVSLAPRDISGISIWYARALLSTYRTEFLALWG